MRKEIKLSNGFKVLAETSDNTVNITVYEDDNEVSGTLLSADDTDYSENETEQNLDYLMDGYFDYVIGSLSADDEKLLRKILKPFVQRISLKE